MLQIKYLELKKNTIFDKSSYRHSFMKKYLFSQTLHIKTKKKVKVKKEKKNKKNKIKYYICRPNEVVKSND